MNEDANKAWSDLTCAIVTGAIIFIPLLFSFGIQMGFLLAICLTAVYYILVKVFGKGSVVEMGVLVTIVAILFSIFGKQLMN